MKHELIITDFVRTPLGKLCSALKTQATYDLAKTVLLSIVERTSIDPNLVEQVIFGHAHMDTFPYNVARYSWLLARLPEQIPCYTVNCCGASGLEAAAKAYYLAVTGNDLISIIGGVESYSQAPYIMRSARYGIDLERFPVTDSIKEGELYTQPDPIDPRILAKQLAASRGYSPTVLHDFVVQSAKKALAARNGGIWQEHICPVIISDRKKGNIEVYCDEYLADIDYEQTFAPYADGAACMLVMTAEKAKMLDMTPLAKITGVAHAACLPEERWRGALLATEKLIKESPGKIDLIGYESESAPSQLALKEGFVALGIEENVHNIYGDCLIMGINEGAGGVSLLSSLVLALKNQGKNRAVAAISAAGGQGIALMIEGI